MTFKESREFLGLTQAELGKKIGKDERTVQRYESGETTVPYLVAAYVDGLIAKKKDEANE